METLTLSQITGQPFRIGQQWYTLNAEGKLTPTRKPVATTEAKTECGHCGHALTKAEDRNNECNYCGAELRPSTPVMFTPVKKVLPVRLIVALVTVALILAYGLVQTFTAYPK